MNTYENKKNHSNSKIIKKEQNTKCSETSQRYFAFSLYCCFFFAKLFIFSFTVYPTDSENVLKFIDRSYI